MATSPGSVATFLGSVAKLGRDFPGSTSSSPQLSNDLPKLGGLLPKFGGNLPKLGSNLPRLGGDLPGLGRNLSRLGGNFFRLSEHPHQSTRGRRVKGDFSSHTLFSLIRHNLFVFEISSLVIVFLHYICRRPLSQ